MEVPEAGIVAGPYKLNVLAPGLLHISQDLRSLALIIMLPRAGLAIQQKTNLLAKVGKISLGISVGVLGRPLAAVILLKLYDVEILHTPGTNLNTKERLFCMVAYIPKATVQAAVGALPLAAGAEAGSIILAIAVLSVLLTAPLGALGIKLSAPALLNKAETTSMGEPST